MEAPQSGEQALQSLPGEQPYQTPGDEPSPVASDVPHGVDRPDVVNADDGADDNEDTSPHEGDLKRGVLGSAQLATAAAEARARGDAEAAQALDRAHAEQVEEEQGRADELAEERERENQRRIAAAGLA